MDVLKRIEKLAENGLCRDRNRLYKSLGTIRKRQKKNGRKGLENKIQTLLKSAKASADQCRRRMENRPQQIVFNPDLPINTKKNEIIQAIKDHDVLIISGETGSGKTTQIPKFCLEAGQGTGGMIGCTQPRRIAAITVARRIASELNESLGQSVGYKIRFDDQTSDHAFIKLMTDGILLAETQTDRFLNAYDTIIVDEAHERSLNIDFSLGILRRLVKQRKDLKLIITSATIDTKKFSAAFDNAPIIEVSGRMFPVQVEYCPIEGEEDHDDPGYVEAAASAAESILSRTRSGDILIFMPTEQDIGETMELIRGKNRPGVMVLPLFARLSAKEQSKVFSTLPGRKVIVSTNVAETSLTIPGIRYVVDTGLARIPSYSPRTRTTALPVKPVSQSSANQRMGRCGRVENGICIRLYSEDDFNGRPFFTAPEILRSNLAEVILRMISLNLGDVTDFPFVDPPAAKSIRDGFDTLMELGALLEKKAGTLKNSRPAPKKTAGKKTYELTPMGRIMARIPVDPKLSRILIQADKNHCLKEAVIIATSLAISDVRQRPAEKRQAADQKHGLFRDPTSDFVTILNIWNAYKTAEKELKSRSRVKKFCMDHFLSFKRIREWQDIHRQITRMLEEHGLSSKKKRPVVTSTQGLKAKEFEQGGALYTDLHKSLLSGYLSHIAHKKEKNIFTAAKGQQAVIFPGSGLHNRAGQWILAAEYVKTSQLFARGVANIDPAWLEEAGRNLCTRTYSNPRWEKKRGEVVADEQVSLFGLIIVNNRTRPFGRINPEEAGEIFIRHALVMGETHMTFKFMDNNLSLMEDLEDLEHKTRKKDILASEEEMYQFYRARLPRPFFNIRTFARFIKDQKDDPFLHMSIQDLQKSRVDEAELALFPDTLETDQGQFGLEYCFNPGAENDGVTLKVPASRASDIPRHKLDKLVPGLFEEKIAGLIKNLPKKYRIMLMPVQGTAARIAREMPLEERHLFTMLSAFIREKFNIIIPATAWSDQNLPDHLKMRISIHDEKGRQIKALRDLSILDQFPAHGQEKQTDAFEQACNTHERTGIRDWSFPDLPPHMIIKDETGFDRKLFPGLRIEKDTLSLRLFKSENEAALSHVQGVRKLFELKMPDEIKALKKDIRNADHIRQLAPYFNGYAEFSGAMFRALVRKCFEKNIRTREQFEAHSKTIGPDLYNQTQKFIKGVIHLGREYEISFTLIQNLSLKFKERPNAFAILTGLFKELKNLVPPNFLDLYTHEQISHLHRYVACISIRARRGTENPSKANQKALMIKPYQSRLEALVTSLSEKSSPEKAKRVERFFWLLEEYKISVFSQEIKTRIKVSAKKLDREIMDISTMI